jgi:hypothetical protein
MILVIRDAEAVEPELLRLLEQGSDQLVLLIEERPSISSSRARSRSSSMQRCRPGASRTS